MFKKEFIPMFEADGKAGGADDVIDENKKEKDVDYENMTFDEFLASDPKRQAEFDRRVTKGIKTAIENEKKRVDEIVDERLSEAERLAKMTEMERRKYEQDKRDAEIRKREEEITRRELRAEALATLAELKLPAELVDILDLSDAESCKDSIAMVGSVFNDVTADAVEKRLKGRKPPKGIEDKKRETADEQLTKEVREAMARPNRIL